MSVKILAFLQNPWFPPTTAERHILMYRDNQEFHRRVLEMSMTGRRLRLAFGNLYDVIHWDNTSWKPSDHASGREDVDFDHMTRVFKMHAHWDIIIALGNQAQEAVRYFLNPFNQHGVEISDAKTIVLFGHHPNARYRTQEDLNRFANTLRKLVERGEGA